MPSITGQTLLILGGSSGIGAGVAQLAVAQGVEVAIASSNPARVAGAVEKIKLAVPDAKISGYTCDLKGDDIETRLTKLLTEVTTANGRKLDHIVHTAAIPELKPLSDVTAEFLRNSGQLAFIVPLLLAKLAPQFMDTSYRSSLILTSGRVAERPIKGYTLGSAWGSAVFGITRGIALDLAPIRVNVVSPGPTDTEMWGSDEQRAKIRQNFSTSLLGKPGSAEEVGEAYIYLMRDSNITGASISTSGGVLLQ